MVDNATYICEMFSSIANNYDLLNTLLSFNRDKYWRKFAVDKLSKPGGYHCPICGLSYQIVVDQDTTAILKAALTAPKPQQFIIVQKVTPMLKQPKPKDLENG